MDEAISCPKCHTASLAGANFCQACGALLKESLVTPAQTCPFCGMAVEPTFIVCPQCGKTLREKQLSTSAWKQLGIYLVSLLLPPLGLWPGFRYLFQKSGKAKMIGAVAILLTLISSAATIYYSVRLTQQISDQVNEQMNKELQGISF